MRRSLPPSGGTYNRFDGSKFSAGFWQDSIYEGVGFGVCANPLGGCGQQQLTTAWSASIMFEHLWTPALRTSLYGSYIDVSHNAAGNFLICNNGAAGVFTPGNPALTGCNADWQAWNVGSRTQWEPVRGLIMGIDVIYNKQESSRSNFLGLAALPTVGGTPATSVANAVCAAGGAPAAASAPVPCYRNSDMDAVTVSGRIQRDFLP